jgi:hypothetical protein
VPRGCSASEDASLLKAYRHGWPTERRCLDDENERSGLEWCPGDVRHLRMPNPSSGGVPTPPHPSAGALPAPDPTNSVGWVNRSLADASEKGVK